MKQSDAPGANRGRILAGAVLGSATGISALLLYTNGLFVAGLSRDFGLTRTQFGFGVSLVTLAIAAANPLIGLAVDRLGPKMPSIAGMVLLSLGFASLGVFVHSVDSYLALQALVALAGAASGPVAYTKVIGTAFNERRGIALGVAMMGMGCAAAAVPPVLAAIIAMHGWRAGFFALAALPLVGAFATAVLIPGRPADSGQPRGRSSEVAPATPEVWVRSRTFWLMVVTFVTMSLSFAGFLFHFVPMLIDGGLSAVVAGRIASEIGLAVIASRVVIGFLLDRWFAPRIAIGICIVAAAGCAVFVASGIGAASLTAIALGFAIGAELDLMGYLVARYFGLTQFGRIYGWLYCAFIFASGIAPLWVGALRDATGNYAAALVTGAVGLIAACAGFLLLPRYEAVEGVLVPCDAEPNGVERRQEKQRQQRANSSAANQHEGQRSPEAGCGQRDEGEYGRERGE